jgi:hypothetical protein
LVEKRIAIEKEVLKYGEAPAGIKEVFELCRGFERAYVELINVRACMRGGSCSHMGMHGRELAGAWAQL